ACPARLRFRDGGEVRRSCWGRLFLIIRCFKSWAAAEWGWFTRRRTFAWGGTSPSSSCPRTWRRTRRRWSDSRTRCLSGLLRALEGRRFRRASVAAVKAEYAKLQQKYNGVRRTPLSPAV